MPTNESGMLTREQIEEVRRGMHAMGWSHADAFCDMALSALSRQQGEAVAWQEIARKTIMQMFDVNSHDAELAVKCISEQLPAPALSPAKGEGWQPIETAPKDGTRFLAWRGGEIFDCNFPSGYALGKWTLNQSFNWCGECLHGDMPTHWQPLLPPPKD